MKKEPRKKSAAGTRPSVKRSGPKPPSSSAALLFDEQCRILFDTMSQGVIFRDAEGRIVSANPAAERIFGRALSDMVGKSSVEVHEQALQEDGSVLPAGSFPAEIALRTGLPLSGFVMATLNPVVNEYRWLSINAMPIFRPGESKPYLVYILFDDITERRRLDRELREARDHFELEVQERTRELAGANEELSAQIAVRRNAEASLRKSEDRFRRLAENADDLIFLFRVAPDRAYDYVSPSSAAITGYSPAEFYAEPELGLRLVHPDDWPKLVSNPKTAADVPRSQTLRFIRKDGRIIWVEQRNVPVTDTAGRLVALQGIARDITDRITAQEKLRESEKFLQTVIDTEPECVKMLGADGALLMMNRAGLAMIQADSLEQVRGRAAIPLIAPEHQRVFGELLARVFHGESGTLTFEMVGLKSRRLWMDTHMVPLRDEQDRIIAALGITRDITERKRIEERLRASEAGLREAQRLAHIGSWERDPRTQEVSWSEETFRILSLDPERDTPTFDAFLNAIHPQDRAAVKQALADALQRKRPYDMEFRIVRQDGALRHVQSRGEVTFDKTGAPVSIIGTLQDLTERRRLEDQLRHSQKMEAVGLLAGGISHDFNNILTAIIGYGNLLKMKIPEDNPLHAYVEQILASSARAANLTQSLLAFSRKQVINPRPMDVSDAIRRFEKLLHRLIGEDVDLRVDLMPGGMTILADSSQVEQVLMNLATNARDAMPRGGTLVVRTEIAAVDDAFRRTHGFGKPGSYVRVSVRDTGYGMDKATVARIFEPFFTTKEVGRGTGLGLAIVYGIMKQNNGYVIVESEPGKGSCFSLYFPLIAASQEAPAAADPAPAGEGHETILIAEDDSAIRGLIRAVLTEFGYRVIEAADGMEAVQKFRERGEDIKLVILDVVMPKKTGKEARDEIASIDPAVQMLFISGYSADILHAQGLDDVEHFIRKPVSPVDLLRAVRRVLDSGGGAPAASS
jgi:PAS domain S-box-containing protein